MSDCSETIVTGNLKKLKRLQWFNSLDTVEPTLRSVEEVFL